RPAQRDPTPGHVEVASVDTPAPVPRVSLIAMLGCWNDPASRAHLEQRGPYLVAGNGALAPRLAFTAEVQPADLAVGHELGPEWVSGQLPRAAILVWINVDQADRCESSPQPIVARIGNQRLVSTNRRIDPLQGHHVEPLTRIADRGVAASRTTSRNRPSSRALLMGPAAPSTQPPGLGDRVDAASDVQGI